MVPTTSSFITSQNTKIHYLAKNLQKKQSLSILFVPGLMMPAWIFEKQLDYFGNKCCTVAIDPRSQGDSEQSSEGHYAVSLARDIRTIVEQLGLQNLVLVGWSIGVPEAVNYAVQYKDLRKLILVDGIVGFDPSVPFYKSAIDYWTQLQTDRIPNTKEFIKDLFKQPQDALYLEKLTQDALRVPTNTVMTLIENYLLQDFRPLLPKIDIPTMIATVEGPRLGYMQYMQKQIPNARLEVFKEAGHALFVDQPEQFNRLLEEFIINENLSYERSRE